jgi:uncharacterized membrane protein YesL
MGAFRTLWAALVSLYEETLILVGGNFGAFVVNLPIGLVLLGLIRLFIADEQQVAASVALAALGWFMPTPGNIALAGLTQVAAGPDVPRLSAFWTTLRQYWSLAARCSLVSLLVLCMLIWNIAFYVNFGPGWPLFVTIFWLYALLFWLSLHIYLVPLSVHVAEPRVFDLYRRAAFIALGHAGYTLVLLLLLLVVAVVSVVFLPVYILVAGAFISVAQAHALREIRRRHGDLAADAETEEEVSRL